MNTTAATVLPTAKGVEHLSFTVADLDEASSFFENIFGCERLYDMGPFGDRRGAFMRTFANADVRSEVRRMRVLRSPFLNIEMFEATYPGQRQLWPHLLDIGGWHLAGYVDDIDAAIAYLETQDLYILGTGKKPTGGPEEGEGSFACHCMTDWGFHFELLTYPNGRAYRADFDSALWNPATPDRGAPPRVASRPGCMPGFRGFEHLSVAVADLDQTAALLQGVLGAEPFYDLEPRVEARTSGFAAYTNCDARSRPTRVRLFRTPYLNIEIIEATYPGQNTLWPAMFDIGGWHLAFYVDDVDAALDFLATCDVYVLGGKKPAYDIESGEGSYTVHCVAPFGLYFELVTFPAGRPATASMRPLPWHPGHPER
jgi:catechol 2,3-dioxygenase-like lactoylglutathione lyase family enzyme